MSYLATNQTLLSRFSHHWLWGLQIDKPNRTTLSALALLLDTPGLRTLRQDAVHVINQRHPILRSFYWLFNISDYRLHYYQLQAYWSLRLFTQGLPMFTHDAPISLFRIREGAAFALGLLPDSVQHSITWFSETLLSYFPFITPLELPEPGPVGTPIVAPTGPGGAALTITASPLSRSDAVPSTTTSFIVQPAMLTPLATLEMTDVIEGQTLDLARLIRAYRAACVRTHPDKTGGDSTAFLTITEAYNTILDLIAACAEAAQRPGGSSRYPFFELRQMAAEIAILRGDSDRRLESYRQMALDRRQMAARLEEQRLEISQLTAEARALTQWQLQKNAAAGLPPLTEEDIAGVEADPDYFKKKAQREREAGALPTAAAAPTGPSVFFQPASGSPSTLDGASSLTHAAPPASAPGTATASGLS